MGGQLLIAAGPGEWRAAWVEAGAAVELYVERGDLRPAGSIHRGRVVRRIAGLDAALVEIGDQRPGFLPFRGVGPDEGASVIVQVRREAQRDKGALLTQRIDASHLAEQVASPEPPAQVFPAPGFAAALALRIPDAPQTVLIDDAAIVGELRQVFPTAEVTRQDPADWPIDLDAVFDAALAATIPLPGGGSVHFDQTRAAVLVDVDTGSPETGSAERSAAATNLAAAEVVARQIRLRQLAGGIVVDFAALEGRGPRERVRQAMIAALAGDPVQPQVLGWTRLGHLEIVRPRSGRALSEAMLEPETRHKTAVSLAFEALRRLYAEARAQPSANWRLLVAPAVETALRGPAAAGLRALETRLGRTIAIEAVAEPTARAFDIAAV